jgi:hypothetical protein
MGLGLGFSKSSYDDKKLISSTTTINNVTINKLPNPDPNNYKILQALNVGRFLILKINYVDCTNYEGNKILVFENATLEELINQKSIDPHFSNNKKFKSPICRFEPTKKGWMMAKALCMQMVKGDFNATHGND